MNLAEVCHKVTRTFPTTEAYGMTSQIRRASVSILADIAEGHGRERTGSFIQFLRIAQASLKELETRLIPAGWIVLLATPSSKALLSQAGEIGKMLRSMIRRLQSLPAS